MSISIFLCKALWTLNKCALPIPPKMTHQSMWHHLSQVVMFLLYLPSVLINDLLSHPPPARLVMLQPYVSCCVFSHSPCVSGDWGISIHRGHRTATHFPAGYSAIQLLPVCLPPVAQREGAALRNMQTRRWERASRTSKSAHYQLDPRLEDINPLEVNL